MSKPQPRVTTPEAEDAAVAAAVKAGLVSLNKGRAVPYEAVRRWLLSWGTDKELPPPECP